METNFSKVKILMVTAVIVAVLMVTAVIYTEFLRFPVNIV
jgi:hypothetical protein